MGRFSVWFLLHIFLIREHKMLKKICAVFSLLVLLSSNSGATTIDFEASGTPGFFNDLDYAIDGFVFNPTMDSIDISPSGWVGNGPAHSGSFAALNNSNGAAELKLLDGGTFAFESLWLKGWDSEDTHSFVIRGFLGGTEVGSVGGSLAFSWAKYVGSFSSIDKLTIEVEEIDTFLVDDIVVTPLTSPVPEPETYAMLLAGLGLLGFVARRRKESVV